MKKILLIGVILCLGLIAYARVDVAIGINGGVPYYAEPPSYYDPAVGGWMDEPAQVIMIDGAPHRMHLWNGRWYDEAWRGRDHHRPINREWPDHDWDRWHH